MKKILLSAAMLTTALAMAQNTGIGTTNPQAKLEVISQTSAATNLITKAGTGIINLSLIPENILQHRFVISTNRDTQTTKLLAYSPSYNVDSKIVIDHATGNIGLGDMKPLARLHIPNIGNNLRSSILVTSAEESFKISTYQGVTGINSLVGQLGLEYHNYTDESIATNSMIKFYRGPSEVGGSMAFTSNNDSEVMRIAANNSVGIGTTNPTEKLEVAGNIKSTNLAGTSDRVVVADANGVLKTGSQTIAQATSKWTNDAANQVVKLTNLSDGTTARTDVQNLFIKDNGNVGIGGNSLFGFKLDVQGIAAAQSHFSYGDTGTMANHPSFKNFVQGSGGGFITEGTVLGDFGSYDFKSMLDGIPNGGTNLGGSYITTYATQNFTATNKGSDMRFFTTDNNSANATEKMRLDQNGNVAIGGDTSLGFKLDVKGTIAAPTIATYNQSNGPLGNHANFVTLTNRDTNSSYVTTNAILGEFASYDGKSYFAKFFGSTEGQGGASIRTFATEDYSSTNKGSRMLLSTTSNGTSDQTVKMAIENNGNVGIGLADVATQKLEVAGKVKATTAIFTNLPVYASDGAADADTALPSGSLYKLSGTGRQVFVKP